MTKNERNMMLELARGIAVLSQAVDILAKKERVETDIVEIHRLLKDSEAGIKKFVELANQEWITRE